MRSLSRRPWIQDWAPAAVLALAAQAEFHLHAGHPRAPGLQALAYLMTTLALGFRRTRPLWVVAAQIGALDGAAALVPPADVLAGLLALLLGVFTLAASDRVPQPYPALAGVVAGFAFHMLRDPEVNNTFTVVVEFFVLSVVIGAGLAVRERERRLAVAQLLTKAAQDEREASIAQALARERAKLARELHDVIAHNVSVMLLQTGAARQRLGTGKDAQEPLLAVERTGREALGELRRLLGLLSGDLDGADLSPPPGLGNLGDLLARVRSTGLGVEVRLEGSPRPLPPDLELSAYRIVQESVTNVLKHAGATRADIVLRYREAALDIEVVDDGAASPRPPGPSGHGLIGLQERAALFGGTFQAGPSPGGGFRVAASLPVAAPLR